MRVPAPRSIATVVASIGLVVVAASCTRAHDPPRTPPAPPVKLALVSAIEVPTPEVLVLTGLVKAHQRAEITTEIPGTVVSVRAELGQRVKANEPLASLDVQSAKLSAREARANLQAARAERAVARNECRRAQELVDRGAITPSEYEKEKARCVSALQQVSVAEARSQISAKSVGAGLIRAPFDGLIAERKVTPGEWVTPGRVLFTVIDDAPLTVELSVPESAVHALSRGQRVWVTAVAYPDQRYAAQVTRIGAEIATNRSLTVEATLDAGSKLLPGMFAEARVLVGTTPRPALPESAVVQRGKRWHAFVAVHGELEDRIVKLGPPPAAGQVSITDGVATGDKVVATITDKVVDSLRVVE